MGLPVGWLVVLWAWRDPKLAGLAVVLVGLLAVVVRGIGPRWWGRKTR